MAKLRNIIKTLSFFFFLLAATAPSLSSATSATDTFVFGGCSQQKFSPASAYESNLNSLLTSLVNSATYSSYNNFTIMGSSSSDTAHGLFQCRGDLSMPDCATCVVRAVSQVGPLCPFTCGGALQLAGCYIKYDNISFLGQEDKTVVLKKCGPSEGYNTDGISRRDAVLTELVNGGGYFRAGGSGDVQGMGQCVGDLTVSECQDCLGTAIGRLKNDCGTAVFGDMFLAKCYARYSTDGAQHYAKSHSYKTNYGGERTFAIIIGLLAGVVLLIIFLLFLRGVCSRGGDFYFLHIFII
ncbi:hypothetical protein ARALYDRAFT_493742 [Arabidopsis lyrata subsp. lyrata]|uniref:Gnk2-homologous domain-containing protein n=1 Tax=Arabidopsis lyrata subsp. lyrata TaxID=81972 RepID=D7MIF7_ARALL|nr:hypothetical protein ARALYDRAFT_493742 [Arabidopsis lyrata subsp. lyrata]